MQAAAELPLTAHLDVDALVQGEADEVNGVQRLGHRAGGTPRTRTPRGRSGGRSGVTGDGGGKERQEAGGDRAEGRQKGERQQWVTGGWVSLVRLLPRAYGWCGRGKVNQKELKEFSSSPSQLHPRFPSCAWPTGPFPQRRQEKTRAMARRARRAESLPPQTPAPDHLLLTLACSDTQTRTTAPARLGRPPPRPPPPPPPPQARCR